MVEKNLPKGQGHKISDKKPMSQYLEKKEAPKNLSKKFVAVPKKPSPKASVVKKPSPKASTV